MNTYYLMLIPRYFSRVDLVDRFKIEAVFIHHGA